MNCTGFDSPVYYRSMNQLDQNTLDNSNDPNSNIEQVTFINCAHKYCMCFVDIVDSTKNTCDINGSDKIQGYYSIFLNTMSSIIKKHNGRVIKNSGDGLLYYFPKTVDSKNELAFQDVLDCGLAMIEANNSINQNFTQKGLSSVRYRISANYGKVELAISVNSYNVDLFGPPVNICSKINHLASSNEMIVNNDLFEVLKRTSFYQEYSFKVLEKNFDEDVKSHYVAYSVHPIDDASIRKEIEEKRKRIFIERQQNHRNLNNSSFNILLIDDDEDILFAFNSIISSEGYNVTSFSSSSNALSHFSNKNPYFYHLVIMDIRMPELNGIKLYSHLKVLNPDVKVLFLSALNALDEVLSIFPEIKYREIIRKPIEPDALLSIIKSILCR
ncbi:MAG: response regulator [Candidatus Nitrosocosmicus sp.]|nr:response regulator [Candidatus Nitrosocosmicus sp.]MDN5866943.1 response regulator [Candidatus Nitrosocosmicus sp.]